MSDSPTRGWWGDGPAPWERWPGVSLELRAEWTGARWESPCGRFYYDSERADLPSEFAETYLQPTMGEHAGKPLAFLEWQRDLVVRPLFGWLRVEDDRRRFSRVYVEVAKKNGKALALDTPLPTPSGWTTMGEVGVGDEVVGPDGKPARVVNATDVMHGHDCYRVSFSDGTSVVADAAHLWTVRVRSSRYRTETLTTESLRDRLRLEYRGSAGFNYSIPMHAPLAGEWVTLPIEPYTLGAWLGDGSSSGPLITTSYDDAELLGHIGADGYSVDERASSNDTSGLYRIGSNLGHGVMMRQLRLMGLVGSKHVPRLYLRASIRQRMELLRGLMDTDGHVSKSGQCEFTTVSPRLRDGVIELLRSLGYKATIATKRATIDGRDCGEKYRIRFYADASAPCFKLSRKVARLKPERGRTRTHVRHIVGVDPVPSVPVRCIQVAREDGLFLCGEGMVTTHNSMFCSALGPYLAFADGEPGAQVYVAAGDEEQAKIVWSESRKMVEGSDALISDLGIEPLASSLYQTKTNSSFRALTAKAATKHGFNVHALIFDELHAQRSRELWETLVRGISARRQPVILVITTAGDDRESICYEEHERALGVIDGTREEDYFLPVVFRLEDGDDWTDESVWHKVNPGLGVVKSLQYMREECAAAQSEPRKRNDFLRLELTVWTESRSVWITPEAWEMCKRETEGDPPDLGELVCCLGLDLSETTDLTAMVAAFRRPDPRPPTRIEVEGETRESERRTVAVDFSVELKAWFWLPAASLRDRVRKDGVPYDVWRDQGWLTMTEGAIIDYRSIRETLLDAVMPSFNVSQVGFDPYNARQLATVLMEDGVPMVEVRQGMRTLSEPCKLLEGLIASGRVWHDGNPVLRWCFANAEVQTDANGNIRPVKPGGDARGTRRIDGVVATVIALSRLMVTPEVEESGGVTFFSL